MAMDRLEDLMKILREEYGINSAEELNDAIKNLGGIDITPFCQEREKLIDEKAS